MANKITVTSAGTVANANVTPDTAMYYSNKSRDWAISDRIVDNIDYSSKYYANESKKQADISTAKATEVIESGNTAVSNIESARNNAITNVNTAGATQVALATEQATIATNKASEVVASGNEALSNINTAKNNAITSITNQETASKTVLIDEGTTQIGLIQNEGATQVANVQSTGFYMRDDKLYFINSQGEETEFKSGGSGLEICDIGMALYIDETKGLRRYLNGQIVDINTNTQAFLNRLKEITTLHPSLLCTEEEWQTAKTMSAFGQVGKFVFNYSGENIVSVRLPRVVNVQGLFDLQNLGMTVDEKLPNIKGEITFARSMVNDVSGFVQETESNVRDQTSSTSGGRSISAIDFDASRSSSTYQNGAPVQQEAIQYPYFIQIATGSETENNIINDIELNNPYSLFECKYSDHELNNLSWLKSEGQWNAKAVYTDAYDKILENVNKCVKGFLGQTMYMWGSASGGYMTTSLTPVVGSAVYEYISKKFVGYVTGVDLTIPAISFRDDVAGISYTNITRYAPSDESSSAYITDYDFVLNTADETFRLPLKTKLASGKAVVGNGMTLGLTNGSANVGLFGIMTTGNVSIFESAESAYGKPVGSTETSVGRTNINTMGVTTDPTKSGIELSDSGLYLYFYVGETVQNANLIDAGRIGEQLANKQDKCIHIIEPYVNGTSGYNIWSNGYCEQWGKASLPPSGTTVNLLKTYKDINYNLVGIFGGTTVRESMGTAEINTENSFKIYHEAGLNAGFCLRWKTSGYLAQGEY